MWKLTYKAAFSKGFQYIIEDPNGTAPPSMGLDGNVVAAFPTEDAAKDYLALKGMLTQDPDPARDCPSCGELGARDPWKQLDGKLRIPRFCRKCSIEFAHFRSGRPKKG